MDKTRSSWLRQALVVGAIACAASPCRAQQAPAVGYAFPPGGKAGTTVAVQLGGYDWTPDTKFFVDDPRVKLKTLTKPGPVLMHEPPFWFGIKSFTNDPPLPREVAAQFTLPADMPAGPIHWRVANAGGGSNSGVFIVSKDKEIIEDENRTGPRQLAVLPVTVSGRLRHIEEVDRYRFLAERSGPVTCDLAARRLGSDWSGVLEIHDAGGRLSADAVDTEGLDPAVTFFAERGKAYVIAVRDLDYRGYRSFTYRLTVTPGPRVLAALPAVAGAARHARSSLSASALPPVKRGWKASRAKFTFPTIPCKRPLPTASKLSMAPPPISS